MCDLQRALPSTLVPLGSSSVMGMSTSSAGGGDSRRLMPERDTPAVVAVTVPDGSARCARSATRKRGCCLFSSDIARSSLVHELKRVRAAHDGVDGLAVGPDG